MSGTSMSWRKQPGIIYDTHTADPANPALGRQGGNAKAGYTKGGRTQPTQPGQCPGARGEPSRPPRGTAKVRTADPALSGLSGPVHLGSSASVLAENRPTGLSSTSAPRHVSSSNPYHVRLQDRTWPSKSARNSKSCSGIRSLRLYSFLGASPGALQTIWTFPADADVAARPASPASRDLPRSMRHAPKHTM